MPSNRRDDQGASPTESVQLGQESQGIFRESSRAGKVLLKEAMPGMERKRIVVGQDAEAVVNQTRIDKQPEIGEDQQQATRGVEPETLGPWNGGQRQTPSGHSLALHSLALRLPSSHRDPHSA